MEHVTHNKMKEYENIRQQCTCCFSEVSSLSIRTEDSGSIISLEGDFIRDWPCKLSLKNEK